MSESFTSVARGLLRRAIEEQDSNIGSATKNSSVSTLVSTLVTNLIVFAVMVFLFMILRRLQRRYYQPKAFVETVQEYKRKAVQSIPGQEGFFSWIGGIGRTEYEYIFSPQQLGGQFEC